MTQGVPCQALTDKIRAKARAAWVGHFYHCDHKTREKDHKIIQPKLESHIVFDTGKYGGQKKSSGYFRYNSDILLCISTTHSFI